MTTYFERELAPTILRALKNMPVVAITGLRQTVAEKGLVRIGGFPCGHASLCGRGALLQWGGSSEARRKALGFATGTNPLMTMSILPLLSESFG